MSATIDRPRSKTAWTLAASVLLVATTAVAKEIRIAKGDVEGLYRAVGDPANAGARVKLAPGNYALSATSCTPRGTCCHPADGLCAPGTTGGTETARAFGGGLFLQEGMELVGGNVYSDADRDGVWDANLADDPVVDGATVIDGSGIGPFDNLGPNGEPVVDCTGVGGFAETAANVILLRDRSRVSRVTVKTGGWGGVGVGNSFYLPARGYQVAVSDTFIDDGTNSSPCAGMGVVGCRMKDSRNRFTFERNISRSCWLGLAFVNALTNQPGETQAGPTLEADVRSNHFLGNNLGIHSRNTMGVDGSTVLLSSTGNLFESNYFGLEATGGVNLGWPTGAKGNRYVLSSAGDTFRDNFVGLLAVGGERDWPGATATAGNVLEVALINASFASYPSAPGSAAVHVWPFFFSPTAEDTNNRVHLLVRGTTFTGSRPPEFHLVDTAPGDTNTTTVVGGDNVFARSNQASLIHEQYLFPVNPFDLRETTNTLRFDPSGAGYRVTAAGPSSGDPAIGPAFALDCPDGDPTATMCWLHNNQRYYSPLDDDSARVNLSRATDGSAGFSFPFLGHDYSDIYVNLDGTITFGEAAPAEGRNVSTLVSQMARVAPFFQDLALYDDWQYPYTDPHVGQIVGSVHAKVSSDHVVVTWQNLSSWINNLADRSTFQVTLTKDGAIEFVYGGIDPSLNDAVVGLARGGDKATRLPACTLTPDLNHATGPATGCVIFENFVTLATMPYSE